MSRRLALASLLATAMLPAHAALGDVAAADSPVRLQAQRVQSLSAGVQVFERPSGDGGMVREFVSPAGIVFEVRWSTRLKPRLDDLLGRYHAGYSAAAGEALKRPGIQRQATLRAQDLVVESSAHLNNFSGRAYVPSLVPAGFDGRSAR